MYLHCGQLDIQLDVDVLFACLVRVDSRGKSHSSNFISHMPCSATRLHFKRTLGFEASFNLEWIFFSR